MNLCWDVINYHLYSDDENSSQGNKSTRGSSPELSGADSIAQTFMQIGHKYAKDMPVWMSETGYDVNQQSPLKAIPIGNKTALLTQADWILRSALLYARNGISRVFFYQTYDENFSSGGRFASSGLLNKDHTRKPAADYLFQINKLLGNYVYSNTINSNPLVDTYSFNGKYAYVLVKASENGSNINYTLNVKTGNNARIYYPTAGQDSMKVENVKVVRGELKLNVTETPLFVLPY